MRTPAEIQLDIDATRKAMTASVPLRATDGRGAAGNSTVKTFRTLPELREHLRFLEKELAMANGQGGLIAVPFRVTR